MRAVNATAGALTLAAAWAVAGSAGAGALDRTGQSVGVIFEAGRYVELSFSTVSPEVSGRQIRPFGIPPGPIAPEGERSGDMLEDYQAFALAFRDDLTDRLSYAIIFDDPFGADTAYPGGRNYFAAGSTADVQSRALTALLRYKFTDRIAVHGGLRYQSFSAEAELPFLFDYQANGRQDEGFGLVVGASYEIPEIALRVALTYASEISHDNPTTESITVPTPFGPFTNLRETTTEVETPQSVNLDFQTGLNESTLLFGGVRWVDWSDFDITPALYAELTGTSLLSYPDDIWSYTLGVGRKLTDKFSMAATIGYESQTGGFRTNLGPTDGQRSIGLAGTYTEGAVSVTAGLRYIDLGEADTAAGGDEVAEFDGGDAVAFGLRLGYRF